MNLTKWILLLASLMPTVHAAKILCQEEDKVRRRLEGVERTVLTPDNVRARCNDEGTWYKAYYHVFETHLLIVAKPADAGSACPSLIFHAENMAKEIVLVEQWGSDNPLYNLGEYYLYDLPEYPLRELLNAFEQIQTYPSQYDIVTNNCASFVFDMFCYLGYVPDSSLLAWTEGTLAATEASRRMLMEFLRESSHLTLLPMIDDASDLEESHERDVISDLVYYYAANHQGKCVNNRSSSNEKSKIRMYHEHSKPRTVGDVRANQVHHEEEHARTHNRHSKTRAHNNGPITTVRDGKSKQEYLDEKRAKAAEHMHHGHL